MHPILAAFLLIGSSPVPDAQSELVEFHYEWPAEAESLPNLRFRLEVERDGKRSEATQWAEESRKARPDSFQPHHYAKHWDVSGLNAQLLSLSAIEESYSGGAHGGRTFSALLWDREADRAVPVIALLGLATLRGLEDRYCSALDQERAERRGEPVQRGADDPFSDCPWLDEQVLALSDTDADGRFDHLDILLAPYVAGPWVEGAYPISIAFRPGDLTGIMESYRDSFEARTD